jgi:hypothetical protein
MKRNYHQLSLMVITVLALFAVGCSTSTPLVSTPGGKAQPLPHFDHIVIVMEENHSANEIYQASDAPYIQSLAQQGAKFTDSHGVGHPSEPNYLALFAGSTFGLTSDDCPQSFSAPNLGGTLLSHGMTFIGYSESLPVPGFTDCTAGGNSFTPLYARKHNPWSNFADVPAASNQPFASFPSDYSQLPTVAFVIPNEVNDMHSGSVAAGDTWLQQNLGSYAQWAAQNNSLLIVTWDEDDNSTNNLIPTIFVGAHVHAGSYGETITHYDVLRTVEAIEGLPYTGNAANATTIADIWQS